MFEDKDNKFGGFEVSDTGTKFQEHRVGHSYYPGTPKIIQWVIKYSGGVIKDERQANYVLIGFVAVAIVVSLFLFFGGGSGGKGPSLPPSLPTPISLHEK